MHIFDQWDADDEESHRARTAHHDLLTELKSVLKSGDAEVESAIRDRLKNSPFAQCPGCQDRDEHRDRCRECHGDGFVARH